MQTDEIIDYYLEAVKIRDIQRYGHLNKKFRNNVAEHCFMMIVLADKLIEHYKFELDFRKVVRYIYMHDWGEIGMNKDIPAGVKAKGNIRGIAKEQERISAHKSFAKFGLQNDIADYDNYNDLKDDEARFVTAIDKLEGPLFVIKNGLDNITNSLIRNGKFTFKAFDSAEGFMDFEINYPKKAIALYPPLKDFAEAIMGRVRKQAINFKL